LPDSDDASCRDKSLFIWLSFLGIVALGLMLLGFWHLIQPRLATFHPSVPLIVGLGLLAFYLAVAAAFTLIVISAHVQRDLLSGKRLTVRILLPLALAVGRIFRFSPDAIRGSFIEMNNALVKASARLIPGDSLLLLLPHCLQNFECPHRVTSQVRNCRQCGKCEISALIALCDRYGINMSIATGGTLARRVIVETRPEAIVGVACERDLTSGIQDSYPIPVMGVLNERPYGPCRNTSVDLNKVEEAVAFFLKSTGSEPGLETGAGQTGREASSEKRHASKISA